LIDSAQRAAAHSASSFPIQIPHLYFLNHLFDRLELSDSVPDRAFGAGLDSQVEGHSRKPCSARLNGA
jgi:hypothetical protein